MVLLATVVLAVPACGGSEDSTEGGAPPVSVAGTTNDHGTKAATNDLEMEADDFYFGPTFVKATAGQTFSIELRNDGETPHTFTSTALGIDEHIDPHQRKSVTVTAPQSGVALFFCRLHQAQGMQGAVFIA